MRRAYIDYETFLIVPGLQAPPVVCFQYCFEGGPRDIVHARTGRRAGFQSLLGHNATIDEILYDMLVDDNCVIGAFSAQFEAVVSCAHNPLLWSLIDQKIEKNLWHCYRLREQQIRIAAGDHNEVEGLDSVQEHYKIPNTVDKSFPGRARFGELIDTPIQEWPQPYIDYALGDLVVEQIDQAQRKRWTEEHYIDHPLQMGAAFSFALTQCHGFMTDLEAARTLYQETEERLEEAKQTTLANGLAKWKREDGVLKVARCIQPAKDRITKAYNDRGLEAPRNVPTDLAIYKAYVEDGGQTDANPKDKRALKSAARKMLEELKAGGYELEGGISLDEEACRLSLDPVMVAYSDHGQANSILKRVALLVRAAEQGVPVQASYNAIVNTGRSSCRQGKTPEPGEPYMAIGSQMHNLPRAGMQEEE